MTYRITAADPTIIEAEVLNAIGNRACCAMVPGQLRIAPLESQRDFLAVNRRLTAVATAHPNEFSYVAFAAETGSRMRSNVQHDTALASEIVSHVPG
ncbi:MAG: hypothetical protein ACT4O1_14300 [Gemmatimonadota bacterium]